MIAQPLNAATIELRGKHLIEASAGTGKTYNITRLYLRLIIEKKLTVQQILVMTFTRAATEELRGRIRAEISAALTNWHSLIHTDEFFQHLATQHDEIEIKTRLNVALLHIDEAAIFTIHGFCKRVLTEQAFTSGIDFSMQMEADTSDLTLECIRDWYRLIAKTEVENFAQITEKWPEPEQFYQEFASVISAQSSVFVTNKTTFEQRYIAAQKQWLAELLNIEELIAEQLINDRKDTNARHTEWLAVKAYLTSDELSDIPKTIKDFCHGNRLRAKSVSPEVKQTLGQVKALQQQFDAINKAYSSAELFVTVKQGLAFIKQQLAQEKQRARLLNFDDLILQLHRSVCLDTDNSATIISLLQQQYPVALIDEFQDTDAQQYQIFECLYRQSYQQDNALFMIGDPKQAIYGFRGGDIFTYLHARNQVDFSWFMDTNWRSSAQMITGYNRLFYGSVLPNCGQEAQPTDQVFGFNIDYVPVKAANKPTSEFNDASAFNALSFVHCQPTEDQLTRGSAPSSYRQLMAQWLANEVSRLLNESTIEQQPTQAKDIAILVRDKTEATEISEALQAANLSSVYISARDNVYQSIEAQQLLQALKGIETPDNESLVVACLSTCFFGLTAAQLYELQHHEQIWQQWQNELQKLHETWNYKGFMAMALHMLHVNFTPANDGRERQLTNIVHLFELLQHAAQLHKQPAQLIHFLEQQIELTSANAEAELRLESDANLIRIVTQHGSKGLEYPIVFVPFACRYKDPSRFRQSLRAIHSFYDDETQTRVTQLGYDDHSIAKAVKEADAESVRLLYVAITRAIHRCYLLAAPFASVESSPLGATLGLTSPEQLITKVHQLSSQHTESISDHVVSLPVENLAAQPITAQTAEVTTVAKFTGKIERNWWLTSFSALTRNMRSGGLTLPERLDDSLSITTDNDKALASKPTLRFALKKGAETGNLLHDILEHTDFNQPNWQQSMIIPLSRFGQLSQPYNEQDLIDWLDDCLHAPLTDDLCLHDLPWQSTLRETEFYLPLKKAVLSKLGGLLQNHRLSHDASKKKLPEFIGWQQVNGMLHGFIDLIFCHQGKYYLADYKSTFLGDNIDDYNASALQENIEKSYYDLQYLLYSLALHKFLQAKLSNYQIADHFGGVFYLYLRGMNRDNAAGVYFRSIEESVLQELEQLLSNQ